MRAVIAALGLVVAGAVAVSGAEALWTVAIVGRRDVVLSMRANQEGVPSADARLLGPELDFAVSAEDGQVVIRDANGITWRTSHGSTWLDGPIERRSLSAPVQVAAPSVYLPLDAIAQLGARRLVLEERGRAFLLPQSVPQPVTPPRTVDRTAARQAATTATQAPAAASALRGPAGWQSFEIPKSPDERAATAREDEDLLALRDAPALADIQPPDHDSLGMDLGAGLAQRGGAAFDVTGAGTVAGFRVNLSSFLTFGASQATLRSGRIAAESIAGTWTFEGGDLLSEVRGLGRGVRVSRRLGSRLRPSVALYGDDSRITGDRPAVAYRDTALLTRNVDLRGEVSTDGSLFGATRLLAGRGSAEVFYRRSPSREVHDRGVLVSYTFWSSVSAYGGVRFSTQNAGERWTMFGIGVPVYRQSSITLEETWTERGTSSDRNHTVGFQIPIGHVRLMQRYQWTDIALMQGPTVLDTGRRQLQSMASYAPTPRVRFNYQVATQWFPGSEARQWTELESVVLLSRATSIHAVTGFPAVNDPRRFRVGLEQRLPNAFRLAVDYGRLPAFQSTARDVPTDPRLLVMVHRAVRVPTPAGGADVSGTVHDDSGAPVRGAVVSLGRFRTTTRDDGTYRFAHVPQGDHTLSLDREHLPAEYAVASEPRAVRVVGDRPVRAELAVTALHVIRGRVYNDRNGNGRADDDEGVGDVVVRLDEKGPATLTSETGAFAFYNLEPGPYLVWVDGARLRSDLLVVSPYRRQVQLQPERATTNVDFIVATHEKPVLMKELP